MGQEGKQVMLTSIIGTSEVQGGFKIHRSRWIQGWNHWCFGVYIWPIIPGKFWSPKHFENWHGWGVSNEFPHRHDVKLSIFEWNMPIYEIHSAYPFLTLKICCFMASPSSVRSFPGRFGAMVLYTRTLLFSAISMSFFLAFRRCVRTWEFLRMTCLF